MRKIVFTIFAFFVCATASMAQGDSYKIEGRLDNSINGQLLLVAETENGFIDISDATITNGAFEFTGRMPEVTVAYLMPTKKNVVLGVILLENAHYTVTIGSEELIVEGGGEAQKVWNEFQELSRYLLQSQRQLEAQAQAIKNPAQMLGLQKEFQKIALKVQDEETELVKKHNNSIVAAYVVATKMQGLDEAKLISRYESLGEDAKATFYGKRVGSELERVQKVAIGAIAPDFSAPLFDGGVLSLYETKAKVKVIDFWVSNSRPCREENVNLLQLYKRYRPKGLEIISVSLDNNKHAWLGAIGQDGCNWKNVSDLKGPASAIAAKYCVTAIPCTFILDEENRIVAKNLRGKELEKKIAELLKKKK